MSNTGQDAPKEKMWFPVGGAGIFGQQGGGFPSATITATANKEPRTSGDELNQINKAIEELTDSLKQLEAALIPLLAPAEVVNTVEERRTGDEPAMVAALINVKERTLANLTYVRGISRRLRL